MTERIGSWMQLAEMWWPVILEDFGVEPLLLPIKRKELRWLRDLVRMPPGRLTGEVFQARPTERKPQG